MNFYFVYNSMDDSRFCPDCGSENVEPDFRRTNVLGEMIFNQNKWVCNDCGYTGIMPSGEPDEDTEFKDADEESGKNDVVDGSAGRAYVKYISYVFIPLTILYILYLII